MRIYCRKRDVIWQMVKDLLVFIGIILACSASITIAVYRPSLILYPSGVFFGTGAIWSLFTLWIDGADNRAFSKGKGKKPTERRD